MKTTGPVAELSEQQLLGRFAELVRADRVNTAQLLVYVAEIDERKLWAKHACSSMFAWGSRRSPRAMRAGVWVRRGGRHRGRGW
jgi:hypothetical protein